MGVVKFEIIIDQPDKIYKPGETVTGRVELVLDSEKKMRGVEVKITGKAKCKWKETRTTTSGGKVTRKTVTKQSKEIYIRKEIVLCGEGEKFRLPMGAYTYPFSVILPHQLPSSFNGKYGSVSYYAKAKIDIPMAIDEVRKEWFTVVNLLDLNYKPDLKNPIKKEEHKTFCCLCCKSGPLSIVLLLPKTGFAKSEPIPVTLELDNASDLAVHGINVRLERLIEYKAQGSTKEENTNLQTLNLDGVAKGKSYACSESLTIPPMDYPNIGNCPIIQFYYSVQVEAVVSDLHKNLKIEQYITIGDIPLSEVSNFPNVDPNIQQWPNNLPVMPGIQQRIIPLNPFEGPSIEPEGDSKDPGYPGGMPVPGIAQPVPPPAVPAQILPNTGFDSPNLYPNVELKQHSPQNGTNDTAQSLYSPQPSINPEYAEIVQNSDPRMKSDFGALDSDFSLPKFTTSDIQIEKSSFLSDSKKTKDNENDATQFTPLLSSSPSSTTTS